MPGNRYSLPAVIAVRGAREGASVVGCDVTAESAAVTVDRLEGIADEEWDAARRATPAVRRVPGDARRTWPGCAPGSAGVKGCYSILKNHSDPVMASHMDGADGGPVAIVARPPGTARI